MGCPDLVENPHSPEQERVFSNIGHALEGAIICSAGVALVRAELKDADERDVTGDLLLSAGGLLGTALVLGSFHHGGPAAFFRADHQQRQHLQMATLIAAAGGLRHLGTRGVIASYLPMLQIGRMFLSHEQHGTTKAAGLARRKHARLGRTVVCGAALSIVGQVTGSRLWRAVGGAVLTAAGGQLFAYREPPGAYEKDGAGDGHRER